MDYLKLFDTHSQYEDYAGGGMLRPNVSHCVQENEVHYSPIETRLIVKYNVTNASNPTQLYYYYEGGGTTVNGALMFDKVEIDGVDASIADLDAESGKTHLSASEHTVKYTLKDPTFIGQEFGEQTGTNRVGADFTECTCVTSVEIPNSVTSIEGFAFYLCTGLTSVTIGNSVTFIGDQAFYGCGLTSVAIPNSVTSIGEAAFERCGSLSSINIPDSVTNIGDDAFCGTNLDAATQVEITAINEYGICTPAPIE